MERDCLIQQRVNEAIEKVKRQNMDEKQRLLMESSKQLMEAVANVKAEMEGKIQQAQALAVQEALKEASMQTKSKEVCSLSLSPSFLSFVLSLPLATLSLPSPSSLPSSPFLPLYLFLSLHPSLTLSSLPLSLFIILFLCYCRVAGTVGAGLQRLAVAAIKLDIAALTVSIKTGPTTCITVHQEFKVFQSSGSQSGTMHSHGIITIRHDCPR